MSTNTPPLRSLLESPTRLTLAVAESLTSGKLQAAIGNESGISAVFEGGITAYNLGQKVRFLNVEPIHAEKVKCYSLQVAHEMAIGVCDLFKSDIGLSTTGVAEVYEGCGFSEPTAFWAICHRKANGSEIVASDKIQRNGASRAEMQNAVTKEVMERLAAYLISLGRS